MPERRLRRDDQVSKEGVIVFVFERECTGRSGLDRVCSDGKLTLRIEYRTWRDGRRSHGDQLMLQERAVVVHEDDGAYLCGAGQCGAGSRELPIRPSASTDFLNFPVPDRDLRRTRRASRADLVRR